MEAFLSTETLVIELLLIVSLVAIAVRRLRVPYTVALVIVGLLLTTQEPLDLRFTPEVILALLVPPLVFEAAFHINVRQLGRNLPGILLQFEAGDVLHWWHPPTGRSWPERTCEPALPGGPRP